MQSRWGNRYYPEPDQLVVRDFRPDDQCQDWPNEFGPAAVFYPLDQGKRLVYNSEPCPKTSHTGARHALV